MIDLVYLPECVVIGLIQHVSQVSERHPDAIPRQKILFFAEVLGYTKSGIVFGRIRPRQV